MTQTTPESTEEVEPEPAEPPLRRSTRDRNCPDYFAEQVNLTAGAEDPRKHLLVLITRNGLKPCKEK